MSFLIQQTLIYAVPLMIVALAGVFAERSGIINLALEGIMIFGAFIGVLFVRQMQGVDTFIAAKAAGDWGTLQGLVLLAMLVSAAMGALFSLLLSFASINLRADQTIGARRSTCWRLRWCCSSSASSPTRTPSIWPAAIRPAGS